MKNFLISADPELFVIDSETKQPVPASIFFDGLKSDPRELQHEGGRKFHVHCDNAAIEFAPVNPCESEEDFVTMIREGIELIQSLIPPSMEISDKPALLFDQNALYYAPGCMEFGCDPDFMLFEGEEGVMRRVEPRNDMPTLRSAGGHVHVGFTSREDVNRLHEIKTLRRFIHGLESRMKSIIPLTEEEILRNMLYGGSGVIRVKKYGVEYRSPSNGWVTNEQRVRDVYRAVAECVEEVMS